MASKYLSDDIPARAWVVLKKGKLVAKIVVKYPKDGAGVVRAQCETRNEKGEYELQNGKAGGYGYDKTTAALAGFWIDGHRLADHCGQVEPEAMDKAARLLKQHMAGKLPKLPHCNGGSTEMREAAEKIGFRWSNWRSDENHPHGGCYTSIYPETGVERLSCLGYTVIQVL